MGAWDGAPWLDSWAPLFGRAVGWAPWIGGIIDWASRLSRLIVQAPWLGRARDYDYQFGVAAGLTPCPGKL